MWIGLPGAAATCRLVGAGLPAIQMVALALATDLAPAGSQPKVVGLMYVGVRVGTVANVLVFGALRSPFTPGPLIQATIATIALIGVALWKQEPRRAQTDMLQAERHRVSV